MCIAAVPATREPREMPPTCSSWHVTHTVLEVIKLQPRESGALSQKVGQSDESNVGASGGQAQPLL